MFENYPFLNGEIISYAWNLIMWESPFSIWTVKKIESDINIKVANPQYMSDVVSPLTCITKRAFIFLSILKLFCKTAIKRLKGGSAGHEINGGHLSISGSETQITVTSGIHEVIMKQ